MLLLLIIEYEAVTDLTDLNKRKIQKEVLKCLRIFFVFSDDSLALKGFLIDKTKKIFCVVCEKLLFNFHGIKPHLISALHKNNSSFAFQEENKSCKIIVNLSQDTKQHNIDKEGGKWYVDIREDYCKNVNIYILI